MLSKKRVVYNVLNLIAVICVFICLSITVGSKDIDRNAESNIELVEDAIATENKLVDECVTEPIVTEVTQIDKRVENVIELEDNEDDTTAVNVVQFKNEKAVVTYKTEINEALILQTLADIALEEYELHPNSSGEKYWKEWAGNWKRIEWCACFVSYCTSKAGMVEAGTVKHTLWAQPRSFGLSDRRIELGATPKPGYLAFFNTDDNPSDIDHVGVVVDIDEEKGIVAVVEGNAGDRLRRLNYNYKTGNIIRGQNRVAQIICYCVPEHMAETKQEAEEMFRDAIRLYVVDNQTVDNINSGKSTQTSKKIVVRTNDRIEFSKIEAHVWTSANGKDDAEIITLAKDEAFDSYIGRFYTKNHFNEDGEYNVVVVLYDENGDRIEEISAHATINLYPSS